jgi:hypothetical protein
MRFIVTLGLLIAFCVSASAAPAHHPKRTHQQVFGPSSQGVTTPGRFAVPGWTDEQTQYWLDRATSCRGCG